MIGNFAYLATLIFSSHDLIDVLENFLFLSPYILFGLRLDLPNFLLESISNCNNPCTYAIYVNDTLRKSKSCIISIDQLHIF